MTTKPEPALYYSPLEPDPAYRAVLSDAGTPATLTFGWFGCHVTKPALETRDVGDITFADHSVVIEVKTKADLVASFMPPTNAAAREAGKKRGKGSRLQDQIWNMHLLKMFGAVQECAVLIRGISEPLSPYMKASWLMARRSLFKRAGPYQYAVLFAEDPGDVIEIAKTFMRTVVDPSPVMMPEPLIPAELLDQPPVVTQIAATVHGFAATRGNMLAGDYTPAGFWSEALGDVDDVDAEQRFIDKFSDKYGIKEKLLHEVWVVANTKQAVPEMPVDRAVQQEGT